MTQKLFFLSALSLLAILLFVSPGYAGEDQGQKTARLAKTTNDDAYSYIDINQLLRWISNNGDGSFDPNTGVAGTYWPKGTANTCVYEDGLVYGGRVSGGDLAAGVKQLRFVGSTYRHAYQAGPILSTANGKPVGDDPSLEKNRIYKIEKNFHQYATTDPAKYAQMKKDYLEWPGDQGAPYIELTGNTTFDAPQLDANDNLVGGDQPMVIGDQTLYCVMNDANNSKTAFCYGSNSMGIEIHRLLWGYNLTGVMGSTWFERNTIIDKGAYNIDSLFIGYWSDTDLGDGNDDFSGCDTVLQMGYTYNGEATDGVYGNPCPANGYVLLQGPLSPSATDNATYTWAKDNSGNVNFAFNQKPGYKNLKMTSFTYYINGSSTYRDPQFNAAGTIEFYNYLTGLIWNGKPFTDAVTSLNTKFCLAGDPVATPTTGWVDGVSAKMGDRRHLMACGPMNMAPGDTQEVVIGFNMSKGATTIGSVTTLKNAAKILHTVYDLHFNLPSPPKEPIVKVTEFPDKVLLDWSDQTTYDATESSDFALLGTHYQFEGYNIYQLPSATSSLADAKKIGTYDLNNGVTLIIDTVVDAKYSILVPQVVQAGNDAGIKRYFVASQDYINGGSLIKGKTYYFAVTAYSYNPNPPFGSRSLENTISALTLKSVIPQDPKPGTQYFGDVDQAVTTEQLSGTATPTVSAAIVDPAKVTGSNYKFVFNSTSTIPKVYSYSYYDYATPVDSMVNVPNVTQWSVIRESTNDVVVKNCEDLSASISSPIADGIQFKVAGIPYFDMDKTIKEITYTPAANFNMSGYYTYDIYGITSGVIGWHPAISLLQYPFLGKNLKYGQTAMQDTFTVEIRYADVADSVNKVGWSKGYEYLARVQRAKPTHTDATTGKARSGHWWYSTTSSSGYLYQGYYDSPLQVWDVTSSPARQLQWAFWQVDSLAGTLQDSVFGTQDSVVLTFRGLPSIATPDSSYHGSATLDNTWKSPVYKIFPKGDTLVFNRWVANADRANRFTMRGTTEGKHGMMVIINKPYSTTPEPLYMRTSHLGFFAATAMSTAAVSGYDNDSKGPGMMPAMYMGQFWRTVGSKPGFNNGDVLTIHPNRALTPSTTFDIKASDIPVAPKVGDQNLAKVAIGLVNVYPNPYYGMNSYELNKYQRRVTFTHLPQKATIRVFTLAGTLVNKLDKNDESQFFDWNLRNSHGLPVGSGMYIVYIDMPGLGTKILKLGVIMEAQFLDRI